MTPQTRPKRRSGPQTLARGGALNLAGAVVQQGALFAVMALLATSLGAADVGRYSLLYAMLSLLSLLGLAGFRAGLTRFVATSLADDDPARVRGTVRLGIGVTVGASLVLAVGLALAAPQVAAFYRDPGLEPAVYIVAATVPATTLADAALSATQGWRSQVEYTVIGRFVDPLTVLGLTGLVVLLGLGLESALWALAAGAWLGAVLASVALARRMRRVPPAKPVVDARAVFSFSLVSWVSALAATGLIWSGTLVLGRMAGPAEVGVFTVAARLVSLAVFVMPPITNAFTPHMAHLAHTGQRDAAARAYGDATRWIVAAALPAFVVLIAFSEPLLRLFGKDFRSGAAVTVILALGQLVAAAAGPCGVVLNMSGRVWISMVDNVGVLILNVVLTVFLVPRFGITGGAMAWALSLVVGNVTKVLQVRWLLGIVADGSGVPALVVSVLPGLGAALLVRAVADDPVTSLVVGIPVVVLITAILLLRVGLPPADRDTVRRLFIRLVRSRPRSGTTG
ncbi:MAG: flippase [Dermatophilaceae bacterium]